MSVGDALVEAEEDARLLGEGYVRVVRTSDGKLSYFRLAPEQVILKS